MLLLPLMSAGCAPFEAGKTDSPVSVLVEASRRYQIMDGFGACTISFLDTPGGYEDPAFYDRLVYDLGTSILRLEIQPDFSPRPGEWQPQALENTMHFARQMQMRGVEKILASVWSPPYWMKTNRSNTRGGHLRPDMREAFAEYLLEYCRLAEERWGVRIKYLSPQNELNFAQPFYSCLYSPTQLRELVRVLARRWSGGQNLPEVTLPEEMVTVWRFLHYIRPLLENPETSAFAWFGSGHRQDGRDAWEAIRDELVFAGGRRFWMTETSGHSSSWEGAFSLAVHMQEALTAGNVSAWLYWQFSDRPEADVYALMHDGNPDNYKYQISKHYFRYIRPGAERVHCQADHPDILVSGFYHPTRNQQTFVLLNQGSNDLQVQLEGEIPIAGTKAKVVVSTRGSVWRESSWDSSTNSFLLPAQGVATIFAGETPSELIPPGPAGKTTRLEVPAPIRTRGSGEATPLHVAALDGDWDRMRQLLSDGADVNASSWDGWTALHTVVAARFAGAGEAARWLLEAGANPGARTVDGWTPLHSAAANASVGWMGDPEVPLRQIRELVEFKADPEAMDAHGRTPLHWAAWIGKLGVLDTDPRPVIVSLLLDLGARVDAVDHRGRTPLHYAAMEGHLPQMEILLREGADPWIQDNGGKTAMDLAEERYLSEVVTFLRSQRGVAPAPDLSWPERPLRKGPEPALRSLDVALVRASAAGEYDEVVELLHRGANPNVVDAQGRTPLHGAAWSGSLAIVRELLEFGAWKDVRDVDGFEPWQRAADNGHTSVVNLLRQE